MRIGPFNIRGRNNFSYHCGDFWVKFHRKKSSGCAIDWILDTIDYLLDLDELDELEERLIKKFRRRH